MKKKLVYSLLDCSFLVVLAALIVHFFYSGDVPGGADWATHLSKIRFTVDNLPSFPQWCPETGFGTRFLRYYPPFSHYSVAIIAWLIGLNIFESCKIFFALILSVGAVSTYALAEEIGLRRIGCLASGLLLLGSYNIYHWWWIGQLPNITAVLFTPLALLMFLRAIRKQTLSSMLLAGASFIPIILSHLLNTVIFAIILVVTCIVLIFLKPELLYISRGPREPPAYTMRLPKVLLFSGLEAFALSAWWWLPFLTETDISEFLARQIGYGVIGAGESAVARALNLSSLLEPSLYYAGMGHLVLVVVCLALLVKERKNLRDIKVLPFLWFFINVLGGISPYLGIPMGLPYRFGPYMTLATGLLGGIVIEAWDDFYTKLTKKKLMPFLLSALLLACVVCQPLMEAKDDFLMINPQPPKPVVLLPQIMKEGERVGSNSVNWINVFSDIPQSYGAAAKINEFWYHFWYHMFVNRTSASIPYFAQNFNVKFFWTKRSDPHLTKIDVDLYEVEGFSSFIVESTEGKLLALFIGDEVEYTRLFIAIAPANPSDILLVYGGIFLEDIKPEELERFNVIYLSGLTYRDVSKFSSLIRGYVDNGGGVILDTGALEFVTELYEIPDVFPVEETAAKDSDFNLTVAEASNITAAVNIDMFSSGAYSVSYAKEVREGSHTLLTDDEEPVLVYWKYGAGEVVWSGLRLPYHAMYYNNAEESQMLVNMIRYVASPSTEGTAYIEFDLQVQEVTVKVWGASTSTGVWVKISDYNGWEASTQGKALKIYPAGPNMMLVFPELSGQYTLSLRYGKGMATWIGELAAILGFIGLALSFVAENWRIPRGWGKTHHKSSVAENKR